MDAQPFLQLLGTIAVGTGPRFLTVQVPAILARLGVFNAKQLTTKTQSAQRSDSYGEPFVFWDGLLSPHGILMRTFAFQPPCRSGIEGRYRSTERVMHLAPPASSLEKRRQAANCHLSSAICHS